MNVDKEKLSKYFLIELLGDHKLSELINWKVLGCRSIKKTYDALTQTVNLIVLQTNESAWIEEFKICVLNDSKDEDFLIMVSPECPEIYFSMPEEILDKIEDILLTSIKLTNYELIEEIRKWTEEINKCGGYTINKDHLSTLNPFQPIWDGRSSITYSLEDITTTSSCSNNVNPLIVNDLSSTLNSRNNDTSRYNI